MYTNYVSNNNGAVVVFDGYHGFSSKDEAYNRRMRKYVGASVSVSAELRLAMCIKHFLRIRPITRPK